MKTEEETQDVRFMSPESLLPSFQTLGRSIVITHEYQEAKAPCELADMQWNQMDQLHRPWVHKTYLESLRLVTAPSFQLSLTRFGFFKFFVLVTETQLSPGVFYQSYTLFNVLYVHIVVQQIPIPEKERGDENKILQRCDWYLVSHRFFKFLHGPVSRRYRRLLDVQTGEDVPLRLRRAELRRKGYRFKPAHPDFLNSNVLTDNIIPPKLEGIHRIPLRGVSQEGFNRASAGPIEFLIKKEEGRGVTVWLSVCPHEGGPLELGTLCNEVITCPWHGLKKMGATLTQERPEGVLEGFHLSLQGEDLLVQQQDQDMSFNRDREFNEYPIY